MADDWQERRIDSKLEEHSTRLTRLETLHTSLEQTVANNNIQSASQFTQINTKLDNFSKEINQLKITLAKYIGIYTGIILAVEVLVKYFIK